MDPLLPVIVVLLGPLGVSTLHVCSTCSLRIDLYSSVRHRLNSFGSRLRSPIPANQSAQTRHLGPKNPYTQGLFVLVLGVQSFTFFVQGKGFRF